MKYDKLHLLSICYSFAIAILSLSIVFLSNKNNEIFRKLSEPYVLKVVCDDISTIFVDGEQKEAAGTGVWNQLATLVIPASTKTIGVQCKNTGGPYGIMATVEDSTGNVFVVSDNTWKCSNQAQDGWSKSGFVEGASWKPAFYYTGQGAYNSDTGAWKGMSPNKKVIWTSTGDGTVYCRKNMPGNNNYRF